MLTDQKDSAGKPAESILLHLYNLFPCASDWIK